ncbi:MAG: hypothetical protein RLZZ70_294 [Candidatus Parcubacteria bacterium]|jgi:cytoskeletal protein RodZ
MPVVLIIIGLAVAIGLGGYFLRPEEVVTPATITELPTTPEATGTPVVPVADSNTSTPTTPAATTPTVPTVPTAPTTPTVPVTPTTPATAYADGPYTVNTSYVAPGNANHTMAVTLTLAGDTVTTASIVYGGDSVDQSSNYQSRFMRAYESQVVGKKLDSIKLSRVGGASLTSNGFNDAVAKVKAAAQN